MENQFNTIAGWALAAGIAALGLTVVTGEMFRHHAVEKGGYEVADADPGAGSGGGAAEQPIAALLQTADAAKGAEVFKKCASCHTVESGGANGIGPNLWATLGKPHGHVAGFAYSDALKSVPGNWDWEGMNAWLKNPKKYAPGTKMSFAGLSKPEDRANLIAYLNSQGSNLPLPAAPAADATAAAPAEGAAPAADAAAKAADAAPAGNEAAPAAAK
jgi:cytochrome c